MKKLYYRLWYRLDHNDRYLIWYNVEEVDEDLDGVVLDLNGKIPTFTSLDALSAYAQAEAIPIVEEEPILHNLDAVAEWLKIERRDTADLNCDELLAAWNLFADVSRSIADNFDAGYDWNKDIYMKLFWGNNLPPITPEGECYIPLWSKDEKQTIHEVISQGLQMFRDNIEYQ
ncbi:hypothetical protein IAD21_02848 [Abditibacteriota bacterium]|nr:hypothetical protein IAD21_02848 [Abditibacteriota bacterium]